MQWRNAKARVRAEQNKGRNGAHAVLTSMTAPAPGAWTLDVMLRNPGDATLRDWSRGVEITADSAQFTARAEVFSGNRFTFGRRSEWGVDQNGVGRTVDDEFDTRTLRGPVTQVLQEAGWWRSRWFHSPC